MSQRSPDVAPSPADGPPETSWRELDSQAKRAYLAQRLKEKAAAGRVGGSTTTQEPGSKLTPRPERWHEPFPLTDVQQAYWLGQSDLFGLGNVATHMYSEVDAENLDLDRLINVFDRLIQYHPMLRAVIEPDGTQRVLPDVPKFRPRIVDLRGQPDADVQRELDRVRAELSHQVLPADRWPLFDSVVTLRDPGTIRLHISFSLLTLDAWSIKLLLAQWAVLYQFPNLELPEWEITFRDYVEHQASRRATASYQAAARYWTDRLPEIPSAPELPLACDPGSIRQPRFARRATSLDAFRWSRIKMEAARRGATPSAVLLAVFSDVLRAFSRNSRFTVDLTLFNRPSIHPQIADLVGDFTSLTLLTADCRKTESFADRVRRIQEQLGCDLDHIEYSGIEVLRDLWRKHERPPSTVMPIVFTSIVGKSSLADDVPLGEVVYGISQTPQIWLDHQIFERRGALLYNWDYVEALFPPGLMDAMFDAYTSFLRRLSEHEEVWQEHQRQHISEADVQLRKAINRTDREIRDVRLETLFFEQADRQPDAVAVISPGRRMTYGELAADARRISGRLQALGVLPNTLVAVVMEKDWEQIAAVLGILRAGAAYLPIDPELPAERIAYLLSNGEARVALTQPAYHASEFWPAGMEIIVVEEELESAERYQPSDPPSRTGDLAYVIYTSGSTGRPKGVMISHQAAVNTILDMNSRFGIGPDDRVLALSSLSFDLSVYDIFGVLAAGGTIVLPEAVASRNPDRWLELMEREQVTVWNTVPSLMEMVVEAAHGRELPNHPLRQVFLSGDWIPVSLPDRVKRSFTQAEVISLGGATEAAIWSIYHRIGHLPADAVSVPYGRPLANQTWHVLNEDGQPCPTWVPGELYIGGKGLALGYWKDQAKTDARFIRHPQTGERLYRTGDWGRYLPTGDLEFLGREDTQVKVLGHRIELGEIEAALLEHDHVRAAVVCAVGSPRSNRRLVAFVLPEEHHTAESHANHNSDAAVPSMPELQRFLSDKLPQYMIPADIQWLAEFPLTPNGKVDRQSLARQAERLQDRSKEAAEEELDDVAREVLNVIATEMGLPQLRASDNLMHVGASSIDMIRLANRFEEAFSFRPNLPEFFRDPTVNGLATLLRAHRSGGGASGSSAAASTASTAAVILDPAQRAAFKAQHFGLRQFDGDVIPQPLPELPLDAARKVAFLSRRSQREFLPQPISAAALSELLGSLQQTEWNGQPKYRYGSAGGLYPVQTYLHLKSGAVSGLEAGLWYYDPVRHSLMPVAPGVELDREIHQPHINQPVFDGCSLSIFLVGVPAAIEPMYGEMARHFMTLEAGAMTQLLEETAGRIGIGLCQIGWTQFDRIRPLFGLEDSCLLLHSLIGGAVEPDTNVDSVRRPATAMPVEPEVEFLEGEL